jgi:hypothetical protein
MRLAISSLIICVLTGCATLTPERVASMSDGDLCFAYYSRAAQSSGKTIVSDEINKRGIPEAQCREQSRQKQLILDDAMQRMRDAPSY